MSSPRLSPLTAAVALALGIALAPALDRLGVPPTTRWALACVLVLAARRVPMLALAAIVVAGAARGAAPPRVVPDGVVVDDRGVDRFVGVVDGPVVRTARGSAAEVAGIWVWSSTALVPGERIAVSGRVRTQTGDGRLEVSALGVEHLGDAPGPLDRAWRWAAGVQGWAAARIDDAGGDPVARSALRGIAVGDRSAVPPQLDDRWRALGIYHVLSVSGLHLAVIAGLAFALLRRLIAASPWGGRVHPARWAAPPALAIAVAYTLVTGAQLATLRALIVIALVLIGAMLDRPLRLVDALGAAALLVLVWRPADLRDPSFQLSFVAALTLALLPRGTVAGGRLRRWLVRGVTTSAWIAITTAPLTAFHFQQVAAGGIAGNLVLTPLVEAVALPLALAGVVLGSLGVPLIRLACWLVSLVDGAAGVLAHVTPVGHIAVASALAMCLLVALSLVLATRPLLATRVDLALWAALCTAWLAARSPPPPGALRVTFLDVGQGDAALVELPDGEVWLVDAGPTSPGTVVSRALADAGHDRIDLAIVSHPHPDHFLGLVGLPVPIGELWLAAEPEATGPPAFARGRTVVHPPLGLARADGDVTLEVLAPRYRAAAGGPEIEAADPVRSVNDNSLVVVLRYRGRAVLFAGDVEREAEEDLVAAGIGHVDVVKVPHHGSPTSSSPALVAATHPELAVISCGRANTFGFPSPAVIARWRGAGAKVARTDQDGSVTVVIDAAGGLTVE